MQTTTSFSPACACCTDPSPSRPSRRGFMRLAGGAGLVAALGTSTARAASGDYEAMMLSCIDPRFQELVRNNGAAQGLTGKYSSFVVAGASIGVVAPAFKAWHETFWENLGASVQLHNIKKVIVINHRDCGAAKIAYGEAMVANPQVETETHRAALGEFRRQLAQRQPKLGAQTGLMALNGELQMFS